MSMIAFMAYKVNFFLIIIGPALVFFFIKYNLWSAIYSLKEGIQIQGYDFSEMINYQVWVLIVSLLSQGFFSSQLAEDIRLGRISSYLIYPFQFWQFHLASFLGFQTIQMAVAGFTILILFGSDLVQVPTWEILTSGLVMSFVVGLIWFSFQFLIGLSAFWLEETWVLRVILITVTQFLSGSILPLEFFPLWAKDLLSMTPFPYMTHVPVKIFMGAYEGSLPILVGILLLWLGIISLVCGLMWRSGLKRYSAAGM